jgi:hypothetical protein
MVQPYRPRKQSLPERLSFRKGISANVFNDLFRESHVNEDTQTSCSEEPFTPSAETVRASEQQSENGESTIGSLFSILPGGSDSSAGNDKTPQLPRKEKTPLRTQM